MERTGNQGANAERKRERLQTAILLHSDWRVQREGEEKWRHPLSLNRQNSYANFYFFSKFKKEWEYYIFTSFSHV